MGAMKPADTRLTAKKVALLVCFTALYAVFAAIPIFQLVGSAGRISAAAIMAPIIGVLLGPYLGALSALLGGTIGLSYGSFLPMSFVSGIVATLCAGLLYDGKRAWCFIVYFLFLVLHGFYPGIGPVWLFPLYMWFQVVGLLLLMSPLQSMATRNMRLKNIPRVLLSFFTLALVSTLAGQISGSLTGLILIRNSPETQRGIFQVLTIQYPAERIIIALTAALIGGPLLRIVQSANLLRLVPGKKMSAEHSHRASVLRENHVQT
jgi:hypothetical protein